MYINYYSGAGNLFSIIDNRDTKIDDKQLAELAKVACSKTQNFTIKTEGLISLNKIEGEKFNVSFFNPDGTSGMMCGNGARSAVSFIKTLGLIKQLSNSDTPQKITIELAGKEYPSIIESQFITISFPKQKRLEMNFKIKLEDTYIYGDFVDVGSPHLVLDFNKILNSKIFSFRHYPLEDMAKPIRANQKQFPEGVNVSIYYVESPSIVHLRTFERGVEAETGSCGTAAISTALVLYKRGITKKIVEILPTSKIPLKVEIKTDENNEVVGFNLIGTAERIGEALIEF